jgi:hypothetical protein
MGEFTLPARQGSPFVAQEILLSKFVHLLLHLRISCIVCTTPPLGDVESAVPQVLLRRPQLCTIGGSF